MWERFGFSFGPPRIPGWTDVSRRFNRANRFVPDPYAGTFGTLEFGDPYAEFRTAPPAWGPMPSNQPLPHWDTGNPNDTINRGYQMFGDGRGNFFLDMEGARQNNARFADASRYANQAAALEQERRDRSASADAARMQGLAEEAGVRFRSTAEPGTGSANVYPRFRPAASGEPRLFSGFGGRPTYEYPRTPSPRINQLFRYNAPPLR